MKNIDNKVLQSNSTFKLIIKDPRIHKSHLNKFVFYLGLAEVGFLTSCNDRAVCLLNNNFTKTVDIGLKNVYNSMNLTLFELGRSI